MESNWNSGTLLMGRQNVAATLESSLSVSYEIKHLPYDTVVACLDIYPREIKYSGYWKIYKWMPMVSLFIITQNGNQPTHPSTEEGKWRNCHIHTMECYVTQVNKQLIHTITWMNLKGVMPCEISQSQNSAGLHVNYVLDNTK